MSVRGHRPRLRSERSSAAAPAAWTPAALLPYAWWDPSSGITLNGATVSAWTDRVNGLVVSNATAGQQPGYTASDSALGNKPSLDFYLSSTSRRLVSTAAASTWKFLHDGTGCAMFAVALAVSGNTNSFLEFVSTAWNLPAQVGAMPGRFNYNAGNKLFIPVVGDGTNISQKQVNFEVSGTPGWCASWLSSSEIGAQTRNGTQSGAPSTLSSSNPFSTLYIGQDSGGHQCETKLCDVVILNRVSTAAERTAFATWAAARYGVTA